MAEAKKNGGKWGKREVDKSLVGIERHHRHRQTTRETKHNTPWGEKEYGSTYELKSAEAYFGFYVSCTRIFVPPWWTDSKSIAATAITMLNDPATLNLSKSLDKESISAPFS